jgi:hypothetical protein
LIFALFAGGRLWSKGIDAAESKNAVLSTGNELAQAVFFLI